MQLLNYLAVLRKRWISIVVFTVLGVAIALGSSLAATPQYTAKAVVYFSLPFGTTAADLSAGSTFAQQQVQSYAELARMPEVLNPVIQQYKLPISSRELAGQVGTTVTSGTVLLTITVTDPSAPKATELANAIASSLGQRVGALSPKDTGGSNSVDSTVVATASQPSSPSSPKTTRNVLAGLLGGLLLGMVAAFVREFTDTRISSAKDIEPLTDRPLLSQVARSSKKSDGPLAVTDSGDVAASEAFRRLRTNLNFLKVQRQASVIAVTSALAGEGKSTVAGNLAVSLGRAGHTVLLVDADLRRPSIDKFVGIDSAVGLTNVLIGQLDFDEAVHTWSAVGIDVLPVGPIPPNPAEMLESTAMAQLLEKCRQDYEFVIVDTAPLVPVADTSALASAVAGFVIVARVGAVTTAQFSTALNNLSQVGARVLGVVLNGVKVSGGTYGYGVTPSDGDAHASHRARLGAGSTNASDAASGDPSDQTDDRDDNSRSVSRAAEPARAGSASSTD